MVLLLLKTCIVSYDVIRYTYSILLVLYKKHHDYMFICYKNAYKHLYV